MTEYPMASVVEGTDDLLAEHPQDIEAEADLGVAWFMVESSPPLASYAMELITILNRCHRFRGFVYHHARFSPDKKSIEISSQVQHVSFGQRALAVTLRHLFDDDCSSRAA